MRVLGGLIGASLSLAVGCHSKHPADRSPHGPQPAEQQATVDAGPAVVPERRTGIRIVVDAERILVDGRPIGARSELGDSDGSVHSLFRLAVERRILWQDGHPGQPFEASSDSTVPPDLTWTEGANLVVTLASADYPGPQTVHIGDKSFTFDFYVRPIVEGKGKRFLELCRSSEGWSARTVEDRNAPMHALGVLSPWRPVTADMLGKLVDEECAGSCSSFSIGAVSREHPWRDVLEMMDAVRRAKPDRPLPVTFTRCPVPAEAPPVRVGKQGEVRPGEISVKGALPPEVVARIVRQNFGRFRLCYGLALDRDPKLAGSVTARVTIDHTGAVSEVVDAGSKLSDAVLVKCVLNAFRGLTFPQPDRGKVTVIYPLTFEPKP